MSGCSSSTTALGDVAWRYLRPPSVDDAPLNPNFRYLRVSNGTNTVLMALGYVDKTPAAGTDVFYSSDKVTLRLAQGRVAGTAGLDTDWRNVRFADLPRWRDALKGSASYQRVRDVMPGYFTGTRDTVSIRPISPPASSELRRLSPTGLQWFEERSATEGQGPALPPARFAVDLSGGQERVVYSEQCLSAGVCLTIQAWPPQPAADAARSGAQTSSASLAPLPG